MAREESTTPGLSQAELDMAGRSADRYWVFEYFVSDILRSTPGLEVIEYDPDGPFTSSLDLGFNIEARDNRSNRLLLVTIEGQTPQTDSRIASLAKRLHDMADRYMSDEHREFSDIPMTPELIVAVPGVLTKKKVAAFEAEGIRVWGGRYLRREAQRLDVTIPPFLATHKDDDFGKENQFVTDLLAKLKTIAPGARNAKAYEQWCRGALRFLFCPPLTLPIPQGADAARANIRDLIFPNYATDGPWYFMRQEYAAAYVVVEVKNLSGRAGKTALLQLANYLSQHGPGLFGILITRIGMNDLALRTRERLWMQDGKMIVCLNDDDIFQMLASKLDGNDPIEMIRQKIEHFRLGI